MLARVLKLSSVVLIGISCAHVPDALEPRVIAPAEAKPWWKGAVFYEVFVRSFKDSNDDGIGDLSGLIEKLDYLNDGDPKTTTDLGVDALWLMPIFESPSYHGYDTTDYERIARDYGTNTDFERLLAEAHKRGIKIFVDLVLNHTSNQHPWFLDSKSGATAAKRDWYVWSKTNPGWGQPWNEKSPSWHQVGDAWYYGLFWSGMPDLNFRNPAVRNEMTNIAVRWAKKGVDGFRLDAVRHLIETGPGKGQAGSDENHVYLRELRAALKAANPDVALVGEVWSEGADIASYFGHDDELQMLFDFPLAGAIVSSVWAADATAIAKAITDTLTLYPPGGVDAPFLTNHDQARVATALGGDQARLRTAAAILLSLPGAPFIYYGEELGLPNGPGQEDEWKRTPMAWDDTINAGFSAHAPWHAVAPSQVVASVAKQTTSATSLLSRYRSLIRARHASPALGRGSIALVDAGTPEVLSFFRREGTETVLVAHNLGTRARTFSVKATDGRAEPLFVDPGAAATRSGDGWAVTLPPSSSLLVRLLQ